MSTIRIQSGEIEPIVVMVVDSNGDLLSGKTNIKIRIRRLSDGYYLDWSDNTFKTGATVVTMLQAMEEISATYSPGEYKLNTATHVEGFDHNSITNDAANDTYYFTAVQDGGTDVSNVPQFGSIKVGGFVDNIQLDNTPMIL
jgi:hypothetical protein